MLVNPKCVSYIQYSSALTGSDVKGVFQKVLRKFKYNQKTARKVGITFSILNEISFKLSKAKETKRFSLFIGGKQLKCHYLLQYLLLSLVFAKYWRIVVDSHKRYYVNSIFHKK